MLLCRFKRHKWFCIFLCTLKKIIHCWGVNAKSATKVDASSVFVRNVATHLCSKSNECDWASTQPWWWDTEDNKPLCDKSRQIVTNTADYSQRAVKGETGSQTNGSRLCETTGNQVDISAKTPVAFKIPRNKCHWSSSTSFLITALQSWICGAAKDYSSLWERIRYVNVRTNKVSNPFLTHSFLVCVHLIVVSLSE